MNYASIIGMSFYLEHTRPDISFATHQCARYTHSPKQSHEDALIRIGQYLRGSLNNGLILTPSNNFWLDCYPDIFVKMIAAPPSPSTCQLTHKTKVPASLPPILLPRKQRTVRILLLLTLPYVAPSKHNGGKQCTMNFR